ncbi:hypothetical protein D3C86_1113480 [compost metagenome]
MILPLVIVAFSVLFSASAVFARLDAVAKSGALLVEFPHSMRGYRHPVPARAVASAAF